jgi:hypothetical protein
VTAGIAPYERQAAQLQRQIRDLRQTQQAVASAKRSPIDLAIELGITLDPWQRAALETERHDILLLVTRQGGKGMVASLLALSGLVSDPGSTTVIVSRAERQAKRLLRRIRRLYRMLSNVSPVISDGQTSMELRNGSEILALPGSEETIRGIEAVDLLIIDEGAVVPDALQASISPMVAVSNGRTVALSTPRGKRGWFYHEYTEGGDEWHRATVTAYEIPRISPAWLERQRAKIGDFWFRQEYLCEFVDTDDQVFSSELISRALSPEVAPLFDVSIGTNDLPAGADVKPLFAGIL